MSSNQNTWVNTALAPARRIKPSDAEIAQALARVAAQTEYDKWKPDRNWRRLMTLGHRTLAIAICTVLLLAAVAVAAGLIDAPFVQDQPSDQSSASSEERPYSDVHIGSRNEAGVAFSGDVEEARESAETLDEVYASFKVVVDAGVAVTHIRLLDTLGLADGNEGLAKICALMSKRAKRETTVYARRSSRLEARWTCERAMALLLRRANRANGLVKTLRAEIVGINAVGNQASASIRFSPKGRLVPIPLVKEDGQWKLAASPPSRSSK